MWRLRAGPCGDDNRAGLDLQGQWYRDRTTLCRLGWWVVLCLRRGLRSSVLVNSLRRSVRGPVGITGHRCGGRGCLRGVIGSWSRDSYSNWSMFM